MCQETGTARNEIPPTFSSQESYMFLNPWYSGQPGSGVQATGANQGPPENGHPPSSPSPEEVPHPTYSSDPGQDLIVEQADLTDEQLRQLTAVQQALRPGWTVHLTTEGRFYYCNHYNQTRDQPVLCCLSLQGLLTRSGWLPPSDCWGSSDRLPYGWESAVDQQGKSYFVNHLNKTTTVEDPRKWDSAEHDATTEPRTVELSRDSEHGFGFVAGSEKPVIVRFVRSGGPSVNRLMPGDLILKINGEDVRQAPRDHVIQLIRDCPEQVTLEVCQPPLDNTATRKSAILSAAKKSRLKSQPSRVRFAESVDIDGVSDHCRTSSLDSVLPLMPNVLKVFLENGQTKSFKYDTTTRVQDVINSLQAKLGLASTLNFALVVEHVKSVRRNKFTILDPTEHLCRIASRPGVHNLRCLFRVTFFPVDAYDLLCQDPQAFEYLYLQCSNDVIQERFSPELKNEVALRLASLHMYQHALSANGPGSKVTVKMVEKEYGLERFVPPSLAESMKKKEMQKLLGHFIKLNSNLLGPGQKQLTAIQAQLHYLKIISELPSYGAKCFSTNISDSNLESVILLSPKFGISQINSLRNGVPVNLCDIEDVASVAITREDQVSQKIYIQLKDPEKESIVLTLETRDSNELILVLSGYFRLVCLRELEIERDEVRDENLLPYCSRHQVPCQGWNYPHNNDSDCLHFVNFGAHPPYQPPPPGMQFIDSDDSSLWSSSTETTNVDERSSLTDYQHSNNSKPDNLVQWKKPSRFEVVLCTTTDDQRPETGNQDQNLNDRLSGMTTTSVDEPKVPHFSLCCNDGISTLPMMPKKMPLLHPDSLEGNDFSFGLHSPDSFPIDLIASSASLAASKLLKNEKKKLTEDSDLIDLTTLPPPLTPDEDKFLLSCITPGQSELVETPPTPFADRLLEQELAKAKDSPARNNAASHFDRHATSQFDAAMYPMSDIESFIAKVTVPPPPDDTVKLTSKDMKRSTQDFAGFIIPPPPPPRVNLSSSAHNNNNLQSKVASHATTKASPQFPLSHSHSRSDQNIHSNAKFDLSTNRQSKPFVDATSNYSTLPKVSFTDREIHEIKVAKETFYKEPKEKISPRIASIQKMLANPGNNSQEQPAPEVSDKSKKSSPPPPPPRHGVVPKSSSIKSQTVVPPPPPPMLQKDGSKPKLPLPGLKLEPQLPALKKIEFDQPPSLPPRVSNSVKRETPPESPGDEQGKPSLPSKAHRSLPKIPDPELKPQVHKDGQPVKPEKPQLPKKGFSSVSLEGRDLLRSNGPEVTVKKHSLDSSGPNHVRASPADLQLSPLKPRAVSGSPLRINQNPGRATQELNHCFLQNMQNKKSSSVARASPITVASTRHTNGYKMSDMELESGVDSDNENFDFGHHQDQQAERDLGRTQLFEQAEEVIVKVVAAIDRSQQICSSPIDRQATPHSTEAYQKAKEQLTNDSRQFVTASKLFVKSATENERQLLECLGHCVTLIDRIGSVSNDVALYTVTPQQTLGLLVKVKDVAETYLQTVRAAGQAAGKELNDPSMDVLMKRATTLASVLTNLMRTLRVFV